MLRRAACHLGTCSGPSFGEITGLAWSGLGLRLCTYLLYLNGIVAEDAVMDAQTLPQVVMPNHAGFTSPVPRPDVFTTAAVLAGDVPPAE